MQANYYAYEAVDGFAEYNGEVGKEEVEWQIQVLEFVEQQGEKLITRDLFRERTAETPESLEEWI
ncbi:MAG: hypothetical protein ACFCD0_16885 [Gemmataceae bacterium]